MTKKYFKEFDSYEAMTKELPPIDEVWQGFKAGTVGMLYAAPDTGKSWVALEAGLTVAGDIDYLDLNPTKIGKVIHISTEDDQEVITHRLQRIQKISNEDKLEISKNIEFHPTMPDFDILNNEAFKQLKELLVGGRLAIIDTFVNISYVSENDNQQMQQVLSRLQDIAESTKCSILIVHHTNKDDMQPMKEGQLRKPPLARGASSITGATRYAACLWKQDPTSQEVYFKVSKANNSNSNIKKKVKILEFSNKGGLIYKPLVNSGLDAYTVKESHDIIIEAGGKCDLSLSEFYADDETKIDEYTKKNAEKTDEIKF